MQQLDPTAVGYCIISAEEKLLELCMGTIPLHTRKVDGAIAEFSNALVKDFYDSARKSQAEYCFS